jgi:diacylglycerol kinase family enzyme
VGSEAVKLRWARGLPAYLIGALRTVFLYYDPPQVEIILDDKEKIVQPSLMISIMNGKRMGGGFKMTPESKPDDGCFDLCIAEGVSKARVFTLIPHFLRGTQMTQPEVKMRRAKKVSIRSLDKPFPAHADGEFVCLEGVELTLEILPRALEVICG